VSPDTCIVKLRGPAVLGFAGPSTESITVYVHLEPMYKCISVSIPAEFGPVSDAADGGVVLRMICEAGATASAQPAAITVQSAPMHVANRAIFAMDDVRGR
jgi:hypothetical protein